MSRQLIIVESPNKVKTIKGYLKGTKYENAVVTASVGHILEIKDGGKYCNCGIDPENNFKANYQISQDKKDIVAGLKEQVQLADEIFLATDPDREGESIAWSLLAFLDIPEDKYKRIMFHEITKKAILNALDNAGEIDYKLVDSADARRKIDKILGYRLSPIGRKYTAARSVGRCQSAGLKIIVDREKEIQSFIPQEYWELYLHFKKQEKEYKAKYVGIENKKMEKMTKEEITTVISSLQNTNNYKIKDIITKEKQTNSKPPFTTSTFQQEVSSKLNISVKNAMSAAQRLFEGINLGGEHISLITYIRTDSDNMAEDFQNELKNYILNNYGKEYLGTLRQGKKNENAQEGHECLRCVDLSMTPEKLSQIIKDDILLKVYNIIYKRTVASMMKSEVISETTYVIENNNQLFNLVSKEQLFDGYKKIYTFDKDNEDISKITFAKDEILENCELEDVQKFTQPPARYKEATFIKELESTGIGRPSTFATIVAILIDGSRGYCQLNENNQLVATPLGIKLSEFLDKAFPNLININYTSEMEKDLDLIASGKVEEIDILRGFYDNLERNIDDLNKSSGIKQDKPQIANGVICPLCGSEMYIKVGKFGQFYGCSKYPKCKGLVNIKDEKENKDNNNA